MKLPSLSAGAHTRFTRGAALADPHHVARPHSVEQIQSEVLRCAEDGERLRVAGGGTAANQLWRTDENLLALDHFRGVESSDLERGRVWVRAGTTLGALAEWLRERGLALPVDGWPAGATVGGAVSVGAHGSGPQQRNLSACVSAVGLTTADGVFRRVSAEENAELFDAARLSLGALGVVSHVELSCELAQPLRVRLFKSALEDTLARLPELRAKARHLSFEWFPGTGATRVQVALPAQELPPRRASLHAQGREWLMRNAGHWLLARASQGLPRLAGSAQQLAMQVLPEAERVDAAPEPKPRPLLRQSELLEYQLALGDLPEALAQLERLLGLLGARGYAAVQVGFVAADEVWLSPAYQRDSAFIRLKRFRGAPMPAVTRAFADVLDRYDARPHWGSQHNKEGSELALLYPRWRDFLALRARLDPRGVFLNDYLGRLFGVTLP
ncbi:MAG: FAD-binding protein [Nevskiaceae bacterium]|nr:MAG: FAD-binding protein [Nevskiaceae bacterium]TAM29017.1 MAG: FAD-binding protein [Nevskiaceae bacterium]